MIPAQLPEAWRTEAQALIDRYGDVRLAKLCETHAAELAAALEGQLDELLTIPVASVESGFTRRHLMRLINDGVVPGTEDGGEMKIQRRHLPKKPGHGVDRTDIGMALSRRQIARVIAAGGQ